VATTPLSFTRSGLYAGGHTIVLLHGFLGCREDWAEVIEPLADMFDIITIDLPGHGVSADLPDHLYRFDSCSAAITETLSYLKVQAYTLAGYSMGGRIALYHALHNFTDIHALVLISANPGIESESGRLSRLVSDEQFSGRLAGMSIDRLVDEWYEQPLFGSLRRHPIFRQIHARRSGGDPASLARALAGFSIGRQIPMWDNLTRLAMPVLCVAGDLDKKYTEIGRRAADLCPQGKLHIIPGAGHAVHLERPDELSRAMASFLSAQS
jgi:2-succinyl-6-hydroxy-2,4-cyclohexadiene-1-carboxylate synthase